MFRTPRTYIASAVAALATPLVAAVAAAQATPASRARNDAAAKIANALSAGPAEITRGAAVMDWPAREGAPLTTLREGTNGWVCLPDDPSSPGNDPQCVDAVWAQAFEAYFSGKPVTVSRVGYAYMLTADAMGSNTDPTASKPTADNQWHHQGPHVMVIYPDARLLDGLPTTPTAGGPYVMFAGTPIAHVMWPTGTGYAHPAPHPTSSRRTP